MRVMIVKGRLDSNIEKRAWISLGRPALKPLYFYSAVADDLARACRKKHWEVATLFLGADGKQRVSRPDVVVNAISEPLVCNIALKRLENLVTERALPVVNAVDAVYRSSRLMLPTLNDGHKLAVDEVLIPLTTHFKGPVGALAGHVSDQGHQWPILIRPPGTHGSARLAKLVGPEDVSIVSKTMVDCLVTDFVDFQSSDGLYRKYRMVWIGGHIFRRHLIISRRWRVTGEARKFMRGNPELISQEKEFLSSRDRDLEKRVSNIFLKVGLDFAIIDFALTPQNKIIVFELNGTFQISGSIPQEHREFWSYLEGGNAEIISALLSVVECRASG